MSLLRGVCQTPAYVAFEKGFFRDEGVDVEVEVAATAWLIPHKLDERESQFAVMPWTRVAAAEGLPYVLLSGSGCEEAAIVMRNGIEEGDVRSVVIPQRGGIKDLTAMGLIRSLGWDDVEVFRQPSGDGAIIGFFGQGADAASMVEPYATMLEGLGVGRVIRRTGDLWPGAPGCSLTTSKAFLDEEPETVAAVTRAFVRGAEFVGSHRDEASAIARRYIGINERFIRSALDANLPNVDAINHREAMDAILGLMVELGYCPEIPKDFVAHGILQDAKSALGAAAEAR